jgi:hypothetical protein
MTRQFGRMITRSDDRTSRAPAALVLSKAMRNANDARGGITAGLGRGWCPDCWKSVACNSHGALRHHRDFHGRECYQRVPFCPDGAA